MTSMNIYPFQTGLDTDLEPWLLPPDSFTIMDNAHIKHGYVEKRSGYINFGSLSNGTRVMGIFQYVDSDNTKQTYAFDLTHGYRFNSTTNAFVQFLSASFSGDATEYFTSANWQANSVSSSNSNSLYISNGKDVDDPVTPTLDGIQYITSSTATGTSFLTPSLGGSGVSERYLWGGKLLFSIGSRLLILNTSEGTSASATSYPQRARWCAKSDVSNWDDTVAGGGGFTDAATGDHIVSAQFIENQVIVFFTDSVWTLLLQNDPARPFRWKRINSFRACNGKMASVSYDRYAVSLGNRGIVATDGVESRRVDNRIEDFTTNEINLNQFSKVYCTRSYEERRWWTLYPETSQTENTKALIYDDESNAFSTYTISLNCLGYGNKGLDYTYDDFSVANDLDLSYDQMGEDTYQSYFDQENSSLLLGGDVDGNIFELETSGNDNTDSISSTLFSAAWNPFKEENRECKMPYIDIYFDTDKATKGTIEFYVNSSMSPYKTENFNLLPPLNFVAPIINITQANPAVVTAPNHGLTEGVVYLYGIEGMEVNSGEAENAYTITVIDINTFSIGVDSTTLSAYEGRGGVYLKEFYREKVFKRFFGGATGFQHRIKLLMEGADKPFRIHAFKPYFKPIGQRMIN